MREQLGESPDPNEFRQRFPEHTDRLTRLCQVEITVGPSLLSSGRRPPSCADETDGRKGRVRGAKPTVSDMAAGGPRLRGAERTRSWWHGRRLPGAIDGGHRLGQDHVTPAGVGVLRDAERAANVADGEALGEVLVGASRKSRWI
jgi:hypothetical protein